jgi:hypothetical protein
VTTREIKAMLGILIASGVCPRPQRWMFWSTDPLFRNEAVASAMRAKRFSRLFVVCCTL